MSRIEIASSYIARLRGLLGTDADWGGGDVVLAILQCRSVHTFGMRYALDIAFVDKHGVVLRSEREVMPGRLLGCKGAVLVLERPHDASKQWFDAGESFLACPGPQKKGHCDVR